VREKMFDPFFSTKQIGQGSGLGLSMVHGFVMQSQGRILVDSEQGRGSEVTLFLPRLAEPARPREESEPPVWVEGRGRPVLVVDDRPGVLLSIRGLLEQLGFVALGAHDGDEALELLRSDHPMHLLLSDIQLPGEWSGPGLIEASVTVRPGLPVALMTGFASEDVGVPLLHKPFGLPDLAHFVGRILPTLDEEPPCPSS
jgi:CheY-like chemotaxis protein